MLRAFARRLWAVLTVPRAAVVVIEYELLPWFPAVLERWLAWRGCRMVVDYDDALFHQYDANPNRWVRRLLGRRIATVMRMAHTVVAGNTYLADYARRTTCATGGGVLRAGDRCAGGGGGAGGNGGVGAPAGAIGRLGRTGGRCVRGGCDRGGRRSYRGVQRGLSAAR